PLAVTWADPHLSTGLLQLLAALFGGALGERDPGGTSGLDEAPGGERRARPAVDDDPDGLTVRSVTGPCRQEGIVGKHGPNADDDGVDLSADLVGVAARVLGRDPLAFPGVGRRFAIAALRELERDVGPTLGHPGDEGPVEEEGFPLHDAHRHLNPCPGELFKALP